MISLSILKQGFFHCFKHASNTFVYKGQSKASILESYQTLSIGQLYQILYKYMYLSNSENEALFQQLGHMEHYLDKYPDTKVLPFSNTVCIFNKDKMSTKSSILEFYDLLFKQLGDNPTFSLIEDDFIELISNLIDEIEAGGDIQVLMGDYVTKLYDIFDKKGIQCSDEQKDQLKKLTNIFSPPNTATDKDLSSPIVNVAPVEELHHISKDTLNFVKYNPTIPVVNIADFMF